MITMAIFVATLLPSPNARYYMPCDTVDKLNISYPRSMIRPTAAATALLAS